jgi:poly(A) polymerase
MLNKIKSAISAIKKGRNFSISVKSLKDLKYFNGAKHIFSILQSQNKKTKLMLVGGCVRKLLDQEEIDDIDIAINLGPEEIKNILSQNKIKFLETGISHGTITVIINNLKFELTTLRKDVTTDGRHADVEFVSDWEIDAKRRDFTINAIYSNLRGEIYDPLGGSQDLRKGVVKFIGDPDKRIKEDYLRILRYLRFYTQYSRNEHKNETIKAIKRNLGGLLKISKERILNELFKILDLRNFYNLFENELSNSITLSIFPQFKYYDRLNIYYKISKHISFKLDAVLLLSILLIDNSDNSEFFLYKYNLSNKIKKRILFIQDNFRKKIFKDLFDEKKLLKIAYLNSVHGTIDLLIFSIFVEHNIDLSLVVKQINFLKNSKIPIFPIDADYLKSQYGFSESVELGIALKKLKKFWINQNFRIDKKEIKKILKIK